MRVEVSFVSGGMRSAEDPRVPLADDDWSDEGAPVAGLRVGQRRALTYSAVYRAVAVIAGAVGKLPLLLHERIDTAAGEGRRRAREHAAYRLVRRKFAAELTALVGKQTIMAHALLRGNGYGLIRRRPDGTPYEILPLSPEATMPVRHQGQLWYVTRAGGQQFRFFHDDVLHIRGLSWDGLEGLSVLALARESFALGLAARRHEAKFFANSARPGVVLEHPGKLSPEASARLRSSWENMHRGLDNAYRTAVLEEGLSAKLLQMSARDAQLLETRQFEIREVANWFGLPPHFLGDNARTSYGSLEQENQSFLDNALDPWLVAWEEECWDKLLTEEQKQAESHAFEFLRQALVRGNLSVRGQFYVQMLNSGVLSVNEVRALENFNPVAGGDELRAPLNTAPIGGDVVPATTEGGASDGVGASD